MSKEIPYIYCVRGLVRYEESLDSVHELILNSNIMIENKLEKVKGEVIRTDVKGFEKVEIKYSDFDANDLGLLFYGENLQEDKLRKLLQQLIKPVSCLISIY
jgi:Uncharacterized protein conserved in bacteria